MTTAETLETDDTGQTGIPMPEQNCGPDKIMTDRGPVAGDRLKAYIDRIERLEEEKAALQDDLKVVYAEAKATGFEPKIIRKIISIRKMDENKYREAQEVLELYLDAIGMR